MIRRFNAQRQHREQHTRPGFARSAAITIGLALLAVIVLWLLFKAIYVVLLVFGGIVMAVLLYSLSEPVARRTRMPLWAAVLIVVLVLLGVLTGVGWLLAPSISEQFSQLSVELPAAIDRFRIQLEEYQWTSWLIERGTAATDGKKVFQQVRHVFTVTFGAVAAVIIVAFLAIYMAAQPQPYIDGTIRLFPISYRPRAREVMAALYRTLRIWLLTKLLSMCFVGVCVGVALWLLKAPLALAFAILAGLLEFIPTIGPLLSAAPAVLIAFVKSPVSALYVALVYIAVQWIQNHVTTPLLQQRTMNLPPGLSLVLVTVLAAVFGFPGVLLSGPLSVTVLVLVQKLYVEDVLERGRPRRVEEPGSQPATARDQSTAD